MSEVNGTVRKWAGGVVLAGACGVSAMLASCAVEPDGSTVESGGHDEMGELPALVASSPEARQIVSEVTERHWIHVEPVMLDPDRGWTQPPPRPALGPSAADGFVLEDGWLVPARIGAPLGEERAVRLPSRASLPMELEHPQTGVGVRVALRGAAEIAAEVSDGYVVYPRALDGADVIVRVREDGVEDYVRFAEAPSEPAVRYEVELGDKVKALRLVDNTLEFLDSQNAPRLRVRSPYLVDATDERREAHLSVEGCEVDTRGAPPWRRAVTDPGARRCTVVVTWDEQGLAYPILVDPSWGDADDLNEPRAAHGSVLLPDDTVLVAGGLTTSGVTDSTEIYDPGSDTWTTMDPMADTRHSFGIALVTDGTDDFVLAAGGIGSCGTPCDETEIYDIVGDTWTAADPMGVARAVFPLVVPSDGSDVLAVGGWTSGGGTTAAERYDVAGDDWDGTDSLSAPRYGHGAVALSASASSYVIVAGGKNGSTYQTAAERFNPSTDSFSGAGSLSFGRYQPTVSPLPSDWVLVVAGEVSGPGCIGRNERYNPSTNSWSTAAGLPGLLKLCRHAAAVLDNGKVLVMGGTATPTGTAGLDDDVLYDPVGNSWSTGPGLGYGRWGHTAVAFPSSPVSEVLVAGGSDSGSAVATAEIYTP